MRVDPNWFIFVEEKDIRWSFGNPDDEFKAFVINFLTGLSHIGEEIFGENGVASIEFEVHKKYDLPPENTTESCCSAPASHPE